MTTFKDRAQLTAMAGHTATDIPAAQADSIVRTIDGMTIEIAKATYVPGSSLADWRKRALNLEKGEAPCPRS
jgi:hypothetical protein